MNHLSTQRAAMVLLLPVLLFACLGAVGEELSEEQRAMDPQIETQTGKTGHYELNIKAIPTYLYFQTMGKVAGLDNPRAAMRQVEQNPWMVNEDKPEEKQGYTYRVWVPEDYRRERPAGVVAYIPPSDHGFIHKSFFPALLDRNLIVIAPKDAGNKVDPVKRITLAIHAVDLIKRRYAVDDNRVYLSGSSGGGRAASLGMYHRPDLFVGGFPLFGANPIDDTPTPGKNDGSFHQGLQKKPSRDAFRQMARNRYAIVTGETDYNKDGCEAVYNNLQKRGIPASFIVLPGVGHGLVKGGKDEHMAAPIRFLDEPLVKEALDRFEDAQADLKRERLEDALANFKLAARHLPLSEEDATRAKAEAAAEQIAALNQQYDQAVAALDTAIADQDVQKATEALRDLQRSWRDRLDRETVIEYRKQILELRRAG